MFKRSLLGTVFLFFALCANAQNNAQISDLSGWIDGWRQLSRQEDLRVNGTPATWRHDIIREHNDNLRGRDRVFSPIWNIGRISLANGDIIEGSIHYNMAMDVVQIKSNDTTNIYAANEVQSFELDKDLYQLYLDNKKTETRKAMYVSLNYNEKDNLSSARLFEVLVEGNTSLLRRWAGYKNPKLYIRNSDGKITEIKNRRGSVIKPFDGKHEELKKIAKEERLDMYVLGDVIRLVEAYNQLSDQ